MNLEQLEKKYKKDSSRDLKKEFHEVLGAVFKELPKVQYVLGLGYTPGFNDGDPCYHSHYLSVNREGWQFDDIIETMDFETFASENNLNFDDKVEGEILNKFLSENLEAEVKIPKLDANEESVAQAKRASALFELVGELFEFALGTNWKLLILRDGESYKILTAEYEPWV